MTDIASSVSPPLDTGVTPQIIGAARTQGSSCDGSDMGCVRCPCPCDLEPVAQRQAEQEAAGEGATKQIEAARGGGQPLPTGVKVMLETKWNTDLSKVRVHTDSSAAAISKKLNAKALTTGQDIFFGASTFNPTSLEGLQLIAHEAWHTVQQAGGLVQAGIDRSACLEVEA